MNPLAILAALGLILGIGSRATRDFERLAAEDIRSKLSGERRTVRVSTRLRSLPAHFARVTIEAAHFSAKRLPLFTEPWRHKSGSIRELQIQLKDFSLAGLHIDSLEASIPDCNFDFQLALGHKVMRLSKSGIGKGKVEIAQRDLETYILHKYHEIKRVSVTVDKDIVWVEGYGEFLIAKTNFVVIASLDPSDGEKLMLSRAKIYFDWRRADPAGAQALLDTLNPIVDLRKDLGLYDAVSIKRIELRNGVLKAFGSTKIPIAPENENRGPTIELIWSLPSLHAWR